MQKIKQKLSLVFPLLKELLESLESVKDQHKWNNKTFI